MSDTIEKAPPSANGAPTVSRINEVVIRIAGNSQDGIQAIGGFSARLARRSEQEVADLHDHSATISGEGGLHLSSPHGQRRSLERRRRRRCAATFISTATTLISVRHGKKAASCRYGPRPACSQNPEAEKTYHHLGIPISGLTVEAIGGTAKDKGKNIFALGLIAKMFDLNLPKLEQLIAERFTGKDPSILNNALAAFHAGHANPLGNVLELFKFVDAQKKDGHQVVMNGNEALGYGLIAAGVRFGAGYPITPWSDIMELLRRRTGLNTAAAFIQTEDEIAAISMAIGGNASCRARRGDRIERAGNFAQDRGARLGDHGGDAARRH